MSLVVFTGGMFCGKTTSMLHEISRYTDISSEHKALVINHSFDNRDVRDVISSHSSTYKGLSDKIDVVSTDNLLNVKIEDYIVIGIDEANLFKNLYSVVKKWLRLNKHIVCSGLDGNYKMEKFGSISDLLHISDKFIKLNAICSICLEDLTSNGKTITPFNTTPAPFTRKIDTTNHNEIDIGGSDKYIAVCRKHHTF